MARAVLGTAHAHPGDASHPLTAVLVAAYGTLLDELGSWDEATIAARPGARAARARSLILKVEQELGPAAD